MQDDRRSLASLRQNKAVLVIRGGDIDEAESLLKLALVEARELDDHDCVLSVGRTLGEIHQKNGHGEAGLGMYEDAIECCEALESRVGSDDSVVATKWS